MSFKLLVIILSLFVTGLFSCSRVDENPPSKIPGLGTFIDLGQIPANLESAVEESEFQSMIYNNGYLFVATSDGVWKLEVETETWSRGGLEGKIITAIYKHPEINEVFFAGVKSDETPTFKTFYYSFDGGLSWLASETSPFDDSEDNRYENVVCFAARPDNPDHIYAGLGGPSIAVSVDRGLNWVRQDGVTEPFFGYPQNIAFRGSDHNKLYIGSENPLDFAWVGYVNIQSSPTNLSEVSVIVDRDKYGNRRPTELRSFNNTGDALYVGQEGALSKISGPDNKMSFLFLKEEGNERYPYIYAIWVNPENPNHLLFGGQGNGGKEMELYETYDEGKTLHRFIDKMGFKEPYIMEIVSTNLYPAILISDRGNSKVKVVLYSPK